MTIHRFIYVHLRKGELRPLFFRWKISNQYRKLWIKILKFCKLQMDKIGVKYLMEDGAKCHISNDSCKLREKLGIKVFLKEENSIPGKFFWPGNSPDMNPIEHAWAQLKVQIFKKREKIQTKNDFKRILKYEWEKQKKNGFHLSLINSFKKRIIELKKKEFKNTKY